MAQAHLQVGDSVQAMRSAERAIALNPSDEWGHRLLTVILLKGRNTRRILRAAEEAVAVAPSSALALSVLTRALLKAGKLGRARETAERLRGTAPRSLLAYEAVALVALGQGRWAEAEAHCRMMLAINPLSYSAFHNLGVALAFSKRVPEAIESFQEAQRLNPTDVMVRSSLDEAVGAYVLGLNVVYPSLSGAGVLTFLAFLPLGNRATYGPIWIHAAMFVVATVLVGGVIVFVRQRLRKLPPSLRRRFFRLIREN